MSKLVLSLSAFGLAIVVTATLGAKQVNSGVFGTPTGGWGVAAPPKTPPVTKGR